MANPEWTDPSDWEGPTLDEAADIFADAPTARNGRQYLRVAHAYYRDEMIDEAELDAIRAAVDAVPA